MSLIKNMYVVVRLTEKEKSVLLRKAKARSMTLTKYVRKALKLKWE